MARKIRLDVAVYERGLAPSREKARAMIMAGEVMVNGQVIDKPGANTGAGDTIIVKQKPRFVSRGGDKLDWALETFEVEVSDRICADVGASTGGFTDCLLQHGAARVYAIDVGYGQLDFRLRRDPRVVVMERINARHITALPEPVNLVTVDASFISLKILLPVIREWFSAQADLITLVKPQFEAGREDVGKGGVVRDKQIHARVLHSVVSAAKLVDLRLADLTTSPLKGPAGNVEFLAWFTLGYQPSKSADVDGLVRAVTTE